MIKLLSLMLLLLPAGCSFAQQITVLMSPDTTVHPLYGASYHRAQFEAGDSCLQWFVQHNAHYPPIALESHIQGRVVYRFMVDGNGNISHVRYARSIDPSTNAEVERLISIMPRWRPAMYKGKAVQSEVVMPFVFRIL